VDPLSGGPETPGGATGAGGAVAAGGARPTPADGFAVSVRHAHESIQALREAMPEAVLEEEEARGQVSLRVPPAAILPVARFLRDRCAYEALTDVTAVDWFDRDPRFDVIYHLLSLAKRSRLRIRAGLGEEPCRIASVTSVWPGANWMERETFDFFGVFFEGHPDLRRILNTEDFEGWPLRKDFPMIGRDAE
jgi:NADH/F420H2 dehydrogenase subunit C